MPIARLTDAPLFDAGTLTVRVLATPSRGTTELTTWRAELAPGSGSGIHSLDHEQLMIVGDGEITLVIGEERVTARGGDVLILPAGRDLELLNTTTTSAAATVVSPVGFTATAAGRTFSPPWSL